MAPQFSRSSIERLSSCDPRLQRLFAEVIRHVDCKVISGHRGRDEQDLLVSAGRSKLHYPASRHNTYPSRAVDVAPYPIDWTDRERFHRFAGVVLGIAAAQGIKIRNGGDWDGDFDLHDQNFDDLPHFELVEKEPRA